MKRVAFFGCPSLGRRTVFTAKRLRRYFRIQEDIVSILLFESNCLSFLLSTFSWDIVILVSFGSVLIDVLASGL